MKSITPFDPINFVIIYSIVIFIFPFVIYAINCSEYFLRIVKKFSKGDVKQALREPVGRKLKKWLLVTAISWVLGIVSLVLIMTILESNNFLINHSKGIY